MSLMWRSTIHKPSGWGAPSSSPPLNKDARHVGYSSITERSGGHGGTAGDTRLCAGHREICATGSRAYCEVSDSIIYNHVNIVRHSRIRRAIIDRHVSLPEHTEIG